MPRGIKSGRRRKHRIQKLKQRGYLIGEVARTAIRLNGYGVNDHIVIWRRGFSFPEWIYVRTNSDWIDEHAQKLMGNNFENVIAFLPVGLEKSNERERMRFSKYVTHY